VALSRPTPMVAATPPTPPALSVPIVAPAVATPAPTLAPIHPVPADIADRPLQPPAGHAVRLALPPLKLETVVKQGGIVEDDEGNPIWQTLPFVAVHYGDLTSLIGAPGNAVIAGHVVTLSEGNVFRFLYQLDVDDAVQVWDDAQREHDYHVIT